MCALSDMGGGVINQDALLVKHAVCGGVECVMAVICDGMGGLDKGEVAGSEIILKFNDWFTEKIGDVVRLANMDIIACDWVDMLKDLNCRIRQYSSANGFEMGSTFTGMLLLGDALLVVHVGDSRVYHIDREAVQLTEDHTFVAREVKRGNMTPEEAERDPRRNLLLQCVGASEEIRPQIIRGKTKPGAYLLCSDGFRHEITPWEMVESFKACKSKTAAEKNVRNLIDTAINRGERDNISVIVINNT